MEKIVKVEDVVKIIGMDQYLASLKLDMKALSYTGAMNDIAHKQVILNFKYATSSDEVLMLKIGIDKNRNFIYQYCSCLDFRRDLKCGHNALLVRYLLSHPEIIEEEATSLPDLYDYSFNRKLFRMLRPVHKIPLTLDIILKKEYGYYHDNYYQVQFKIGDDHKYLLNPKLDIFLNHYQEEDFQLDFGKNFIYRSDIYTLDEKELPIIEFLKIYHGQEDGYMDRGRSRQIILLEDHIPIFFRLLKNHPFTIQDGYLKEEYDRIHTDFVFDMSLYSHDNGGLELNYKAKSVTPLSNNYEYILSDGKVYELSREEGILLKLLDENDKDKVVFDESEVSQFAKVVYPHLNTPNKKIKIDEELQERFYTESPTVKFYIDTENYDLQAKIILEYGKHELNVCSDSYQVADTIVIRDESKEKEYRNALLKHGFKEVPSNQVFLLQNVDAIANFLEDGLEQLCRDYEVYVSKNVKQQNILSKVEIKSSFELGRDNILSYNFQISDLDNRELTKIVDAVRERKQYYRLENGNIVSLRNSELHELVEILNEIDADTSEIKLGSKVIPTYQMIGLSDQVKDMDFVRFGLPVQEMLRQFHEYRTMPININTNEYVTLRDYQITGVKWMKMLANCGFGGILADEMGLGKSLQTIEYIKLQLAEHPDSQFLIVVPTSLVYNWENEFAKFAPEIRYKVINDTKQNRVQQLENMNQEQVIITTYGLLRQDIEYYQDIKFDTCIIDEAQNIKNVATQNTKTVKMIQAKTKFALTGTPLENSVLELWSIFDFVMPGFLKSSSVFKEKYNIKKIEEDASVLDILKRQISPFILRRKKSDVLKDLPPKIENTVYIDLTEDQKKLYVAWLEKTKREINDVIKNDGYQKSQILILSLLTKLRQICIEPRLVMDGYQGENAKLNYLIDILNDAIQNGHKILLFSQFPSALQYVKAGLDENHISYYYLDGGTKSKTRMELVTDFNQDDTNVFLISLKAGGTGLNLTSADIVIHLDPWWNPQVENQATDRTHRIGQTHVVEVIKMITKGTIEEKILELQEKKKKLSEQIIEGKERSELVLSKLTQDELEEILG